jgi:N12 class adenine-specific DNA methylase
VSVTTDYGTPRINGIALLEQALNLKSPAIYDVIRRPGSSEERKVNQDDTLAAWEKQKQIKERFKPWIFQDPDRTERLVRRYNDTYINLRLRSFDGGHLTFPGMNPQITLYPHQKDAVWRVMSGGSERAFEKPHARPGTKVIGRIWTKRFTVGKVHFKSRAIAVCPPLPAWRADSQALAHLGNPLRVLPLCGQRPTPRERCRAQ